MRTSLPSPRHSRLRTAWRSAHAPVPGVPGWARIAAYAIPFAVLPSSLWRLPLAFGSEKDFSERIYVVFLSIAAELLAFTAVGLIAAWGERFPSWLPALGGREVPTALALVPAGIGALILNMLWPIAFISIPRGVTLQGEPLRAEFPTQGSTTEAVIFYVCYLPLLLWGPLLAAAAYAYYQRRRRQERLEP